MKAPSFGIDSCCAREQINKTRYTVVMNKITANIAYYGCLVTAVIITYQAMGYAGDLAYSGKQPLIWLSVLAFFAAVLLVLLAILIKAKFKV